MKPNAKLLHAVARLSRFWGVSFVLAFLLTFTGTTPAPATASPPAYILFRKETVDNHLRLNSAMVLGNDGFPQIAYEANGPVSAD